MAFEHEDAYNDEFQDDLGQDMSEFDDDEMQGEDYDDSMDGDFDSGMRDAGFGTDEDYNFWGDD